MRGNNFIPNIWAAEIKKHLEEELQVVRMTNKLSGAPVLHAEVQALLNLVDAQWQWSPFTMAWMVNIPYKSGGQHSILVTEEHHETLESWVDLITRTREQMEAQERAERG